jgi:hypothetical protein
MGHIDTNPAGVLAQPGQEPTPVSISERIAKKNPAEELMRNPMDVVVYADEIPFRPAEISEEKKDEEESERIREMIQKDLEEGPDSPDADGVLNGA